MGVWGLLSLGGGHCTLGDGSLSPCVENSASHATLDASISDSARHLSKFGDAKKWPESHYISLGRELVRDGDQVWLLGGPGDEASSAEIAKGVGAGCTNLTGATTILDVIDLIGLADRVVTNDSGLMHVAAAVGTRVIAIYGSTSPLFTPPLSDDAKIVSLQLDCSPCFKRRCPLGHKNCLKKLTSDQVHSVL